VVRPLHQRLQETPAGHGRPVFLDAQSAVFLFAARVRGRRLRDRDVQRRRRCGSPLRARLSVRGHEERFLRSQFGPAYDEYCRSTPRFFPRLHSFREPESYVVEPGRFRRAIGDVLWFVWAVGLIELFESLREYRILEPLIQLP
jgi:hypothetical protein